LPKQHSDGWLVEVDRVGGRAVEYRWSEGGRRRSQVLGPLSRFPTEQAQWKEVFRLGLDERSGAPQLVHELAKDWLEKECSEEDDDPNERRSFSSRDNYRSYLRKWVLPRWGECRLDEVKAPDVEAWLSGLHYVERISKQRIEAGEKPASLPLAPGSKKKIRDLMHLLWEHARRWSWWPENRINPIATVRQGGNRRSTPIRLSAEQLAKLIYEVLPQRERVMVLFDFATGSRRGELSGVKWEDLDVEGKIFIPKRSIVKQRVGRVKTEAPKKAIPLDDDLITELQAWQLETPYHQPGDYVFASHVKSGKQPYWLSRIMQHTIKPLAEKEGIPIKGWHTFRHSSTTLLRQCGNDPKIVHGLLRHASQKMTQDVYDEAVSEEKRNANKKVVRLVTRPKKPRKGVLKGVAARNQFT
jgi:integrase